MLKVQSFLELTLCRHVKTNYDLKAAFLFCVCSFHVIFKMSTLNCCIGHFQIRKIFQANLKIVEFMHYFNDVVFTKNLIIILSLVNNMLSCNVQMKWVEQTVKIKRFFLPVKFAISNGRNFIQTKFIAST